MINEIGAACFGVVVGYITYRTLARTVGKASVSDIAAVIGAVGGAAITKLYAPGSTGFAWYAIGLLGGMILFFLLFLVINGRTELGHVMGVTAQATTQQELGPNGPAQP